MTRGIGSAAGYRPTCPRTARARLAHLPDIDFAVSGCRRWTPPVVEAGAAPALPPDTSLPPRIGDTELNRITHRGQHPDHAAHFFFRHPEDLGTARPPARRHASPAAHPRGTARPSHRADPDRRRRARALLLNGLLRLGTGGPPLGTPTGTPAHCRPTFTAPTGCPAAAPPSSSSCLISPHTTPRRDNGLVTAGAGVDGVTACGGVAGPSLTTSPSEVHRSATPCLPAAASTAVTSGATAAAARDPTPAGSPGVGRPCRNCPVPPRPGSTGQFHVLRRPTHRAGPGRWARLRRCSSASWMVDFWPSDSGASPTA